MAGVLFTAQLDTLAPYYQITTTRAGARRASRRAAPVRRAPHEARTCSRLQRAARRALCRDEPAQSDALPAGAGAAERCVARARLRHGRGARRDARSPPPRARVGHCGPTARACALPGPADVCPDAERCQQRTEDGPSGDGGRGRSARRCRGCRGARRRCGGGGARVAEAAIAARPQHSGASHAARPCAPGPPRVHEQSATQDRDVHAPARPAARRPTDHLQCAPRATSPLLRPPWRRQVGCNQCAGGCASPMTRYGTD